MKKFSITMFPLCLILLAVDLVTKWQAQRILEPDKRIIHFTNWFMLRFLRNYVTDWEKFYAFAVLLILVFSLTRVRNWGVSAHRLWYPGAALIITGIAGNNIIDTIWLGYIRDFLYVPGLGTGNFADQYRYAGVVCMLIAIFSENSAGKKDG